MGGWVSGWVGGLKASQLNASGECGLVSEVSALCKWDANEMQTRRTNGGPRVGGVAVCGLKEIKGDSHRKTDRSGSLRRITRSKDIHLKKNRRHCQRSTHTMSPPIPLNPTHTHTHTQPQDIFSIPYRSLTIDSEVKRAKLGTNAVQTTAVPLRCVYWWSWVCAHFGTRHWWLTSHGQLPRANHK